MGGSRVKVEGNRRVWNFPELLLEAYEYEFRFRGCYAPAASPLFTELATYPSPEDDTVTCLVASDACDSSVMFPSQAPGFI